VAGLEAGVATSCLLWVDVELSLELHLAADALLSLPPLPFPSPAPLFFFPSACPSLPPWLPPALAVPKLLSLRRHAEKLRLPALRLPVEGIDAG
jgi:hypothetical protein